MGTVNIQEKKTLSSAPGGCIRKYVTPQKIAKPEGFSNTEEIHDIQIERGPKGYYFVRGLSKI